MTGFAEIAAAGPVLLALGISVLAGLVSFASPCVVPLVPGYLSHLAAVVGVQEAPVVAEAGLTKQATRTARLRAWPARPRCSSRVSPWCFCSVPSRCWG